MSLESGDRLGPYEILAPLGEGGMGAVYRALDPRVEREVAVKVLLDAVANDPERAARFEREAKVLASLSHPNVAHLYGYEHTTGEAGDEVSFLAMELVEGEDLAERIARSPIPWREAIPLFDAIASGLKAAHELGIVHRDLKPANVKIGEDDVPKVLDFGLASDPAAGPTSSTDATQSPTLTAGATLAGTLLGTAAYMAPEQARGKRVDRRADVWAFGCCLFEALTGSRPFGGEDVSLTLASVLAHDPDWELLPEDLPNPLDTLLRRCLAKDPTHRLQDLGEARWWLGCALEPVAAPMAPSPPRRPIGSPVLAVAASIVAFGLGLWIGRSLTDDPPRKLVSRFSVELDVDPSDRTTGKQLALSPDGESLVVSMVDDEGTRELYSYDLVRGEGNPLPGSKNGSDPIFDDTGEWLVFLGEGLVLHRMPAKGGLARPIADLSAIGLSVALRGHDLRDDRIVLAFGSRGLWSVSMSTGTIERLGTETTVPAAGHPVLLPDGSGVLFLDGDFQITLLDLASGRVRPVGLRAEGLGVLDDGTLLWASEDAVWAAPFDREAAALRGAPLQLLPLEERGLLRSPFDVSPAGVLVLEGGEAKGLTLLTTDGERVDLPPVDGLVRHPRWSPDGRTIAYTRGGVGNAAIWLLELDSGRQRLLTDSLSVFPVWTRDGRIVFFHPGDDGYTLEVMAPDASEPPTVLFRSDLAAIPTAVSPDDQVLFQSNFNDIWRADLATPGVAEPWLESPADTGNAAISPDGQWVAYQSDETGTFQIWLRRFDRVGAARPVSVEGGVEPVFSPDGTEIFYRRGNSLESVAFDATSEGVRLGKPRPILEAGFSSYNNARVFDPKPDGSGFIAVATKAESRTPFTAIVGVDELISRQSTLAPR